MTGPVVHPRRARPSPSVRAADALRLLPVLALVSALSAAWAQPASPAPAAPAAAEPAPTGPSALDAPLFYQLLIGEIELRNGNAGNAYEVILDAARRQGDDALYRRAVDIALQARAGDQALAAVRAWRTEKPGTVPPLRYETQILIALNRAEEAAVPLAQWLALAAPADRPGLVANLPRLLQRVNDPQKLLSLVRQLAQPYQQAEATRVPAALALARAHLAAGDGPQALALARSAQQAEPAAPGPALLGLELMASQPAGEQLVQQYLGRPDAEPQLRLAYARVLVQALRYGDATLQLEQATRDQPSLAEPWLMLGALRVELREPRAAEDALQRYLALAQPAPGAQPAEAGASAPPPGNDDEDEEESGTASMDGQRAAGLTQAWLLLAQAAEQRGDMPGAEAWLAKVDSPQRALEVQSRRAALLVRQGKVGEARALIRAVPERTGDDARAKLMAEAQVLREAKRWADAAEVLASAAKRFAGDADVLYEQAMVADKRERYDEMEALLRQVIALKPEHPHAHNALGYSLADRGVRLPEAKALIERALALSPGDPFITDSLGWVAFRMGQRAEAIRLLRQAHGARPDTEIAAHLGEVLWVDGQQDAARQVWQDAQKRDAANEVLRETLSRLKVKL